QRIAALVSCPLRRPRPPERFPGPSPTLTPMSILGNRVLRKEDPKFLTSGGTYVDDLALPGAAYVTYVRSTVAHGRITGIDVDDSQRMVNQRVAPTPLEVRAAACRWDDDGRLTHWASCQGIHGVQGDLAKYYKLAPEQIHAITPDVGGGFGAKAGSYPEEL